VVDILGRLGIIPLDAVERLLLPGRRGGEPDVGSYVKVMPAREFDVSTPWLTEEILAVPVVSPQVAAVLMNARNGQVLALYGGVDHRYHPYNRAITARRPVGSTIKPFIYLAAFQTLGWNPDTLVDAGDLHLTGPDGRPWHVEDAHPHQERLTVTEALARSSNCAAVRTLRRLGIDLFLDNWRTWGLPPLDVRDLSIALGSASLSPLELAQAFALVVNGECPPRPTLLQQVTRSDGRQVALSATPCAGNVSAVAAEAVGEMLRAVVAHGTGRRARVPGLRVAGKTGTSSGGRDAWFAGWVWDALPDPAVLVVWVGSDDFTPIRGNSGPVTAARVWSAIVRRAFSPKNSQSPQGEP